MDPASIEDITFLARSEHRITVLDAVTEAQRERHELRELTGASRVSINRVLDDLEDRDWIVRENGSCEATAQGGFVAEEFTRRLDNLRTLDHLGENVNWIRLDQFDFDLRHLQDATIITPTWDDFSAYTRTLVDLVNESTTLKAIGTGLHREFLQALADATINGELSLELVYKPEVIDAIESDPDLCRRCRDVIAADRANVYRYQGENSLMMLGIHETTETSDDVVLLCGQHGEDAPPGTVKTSNTRVQSWAESYFESVRDDATLIDADTFAPERPEAN